jgi:hypothetical protein
MMGRGAQNGLKLLAANWHRHHNHLNSTLAVSWPQVCRKVTEEHRRLYVAAACFEDVTATYVAALEAAIPSRKPAFRPRTAEV